MNNGIREQVLGVVAGLRGEKRAANGKNDVAESLSRGAAGASVAFPGLLGLAATRGIQKTRGTALLFDDPAGVVSDSTKAIESIKVEGVPLRKWLSERGVGLYNRVTFGNPLSGPAVVPRAGLGRKILDLWSIPEKSSRLGAMFLGFKDGTPESVVHGITSHELGHAARLSAGKFRPRLYAGSKTGSSLLGLVGALRASMGSEISGREAAGWQAATALAALPMLNEEIQASRVGSRLAGLKGLKRLSSFRGVPSYLAMAGIPGTVYGVRKLINKARGKE